MKAGKIAGTRKKSGAIHIMLDGKKYFAHRLAFLWMTGEIPPLVDHHDGNPANNRWENLREATHSQNEMNKARKRLNTSGYKGVSFSKRFQKWRASCSIEGKRRNLGWFDSAEQAYVAYCNAAQEHYNQFARLR